MKFSLDKKTTLQSSEPKILIFDSSGLCYFINNVKGGKHYFNLPKGKYFTNNKCFKAKRPLNYSVPDLPKAEGKRPLPKKFTVMYGKNPNKCSVFPDKGLVIFDKSLRKLPRFILQYIMFHELGHYFYFGNGNDSEMKCDTFANIQMIKRGWNPSNCFIANQFVLSNAQTDRKLLNHLLNIKKHGFIRRKK